LIERYDLGTTAIDGEGHRPDVIVLPGRVEDGGVGRPRS